MMNWDEIVEAVDTEVFKKTQRHLKQVEELVLQGAWQGKTYEQIEQTCRYSLSYLKQAAGPRLWKLLSEVWAEDISKSNFRVVLQRWIEQQPAIGSQYGVSALKTNLQQDWGEAPIVATLYGRDREFELLSQWIIEDRCRLVTIFGLGGIGKTALSIRFAQQVQAQFDCVIWRSLHYVPAAAELVSDLLKFFSDQPDCIAEELDGQISVLIEHLRRSRCLIVLDTAAEIWQSGDLAGHYRQQYQGYGELLRRLGAESHQSCLLLCTREKPREIVHLEGKQVPVYSLHLDGLAAQAQCIFQEKGLADPKRWSELIQLYRGNPLALKIVATTIKELFGGSVAAFLQQDTIVYGDIYDLLDEQFERLATVEQEILNWLAIAYEPLSLLRLQGSILLPVSMAELMEALESLIRRSLIIRTTVAGETLFVLDQPVVAQYGISHAIEQVCEEISEVELTNNGLNLNDLEFLRNHALTTGNQAIQKRQIAQIVIPIKNKLYRIFGDERAIEACLEAILRSLNQKTPLAIGYAQQNIEALLQELRADLGEQASISS